MATGANFERRTAPELDRVHGNPNHDDAAELHQGLIRSRLDMSAENWSSTSPNFSREGSSNASFRKSSTTARTSGKRSETRLGQSFPNSACSISILLGGNRDEGVAKHNHGR